MPFPYVVLGAGLIGYIGGRLARDKFRAGVGYHRTGQDFSPTLIDDQIALPHHMVFQWPRLVGFVGSGVGLWGGAFGLLCAGYGWQGTYTQMGWFFTKTAFLTFGGTYAVLPYVYQGAVEHYHWLNAPQMIDGLALGETTPGPLIMVVAFVGFVGAWSRELFGADAPFLAGAVGATVATFFTFLPSFLFILIGGPLVEATREDLKLTASFTGITAAVVGVVLNLALFFAYHVLWPNGSSAGVDWFSALIGITAGVALFRFDVGIIHSGYRLVWIDRPRLCVAQGNPQLAARPHFDPLLAGAPRISRRPKQLRKIRRPFALFPWPFSA